MRELQARTRAVERNDAGGLESGDEEDGAGGGGRDDVRKGSRSAAWPRSPAPSVSSAARGEPGDKHEREEFLKITREASGHLLGLYVQPPRADKPGRPPKQRRRDAGRQRARPSGPTLEVQLLLNVRVPPLAPPERGPPQPGREKRSSGSLRHRRRSSLATTL